MSALTPCRLPMQPSSESKESVSSSYWIIKKGREHWQDVMNSVNANAVYYGDYVYGKVLVYLNIIKKLVINEEKKKYPIINEWNEKYPELLESYQKVEQNISDENSEELFMEYFNELRIAANKEYLKLM